MVRFDDLAANILLYNEPECLDILTKVYIFSAGVHKGHVRASGEPYLIHLLEVAMIVSDMQLDIAAVASAILHDTVEDTHASIEEIKKNFGEEIAFLVDGVTKLSKLAFGDTSVREAENYRKMVLAMAKDIRIILIKLADRLHNMRTLEHLPVEKQKKIAKETMDIYAPLANRLGLGLIKGELEDIALNYNEPKMFKEIKEKVYYKREERLIAIEEAKEAISQKLNEANIQAKIVGRPKLFFSIYNKMTKKGLAFNEVMDLMGVRIITKNLSDCYAALGIIHSMWKPVPGEFDDYIAMPKTNLYQSLHTAVIWREDSHPLEVQIRTEEMHIIAEHGIAAHWKYKENDKVSLDFGRKLHWLDQLSEIGKNLKDSKEFVKFFKLDLFPNEVYIFTPDGKVMALPKGSTPIDFAYCIHAEVGHHCVGAKIDGRIVPLKYQLKTGNICEIRTSPSHKPSKDWLKLVKTSKALSRIKHWLRQEQSERSFSFGKEIYEKEIKKYNLNFKHLEKSGKIQEVTQQFGFKSVKDLMMGVGNGKISVKQIARKISPVDEESQKESKLKRLPRNADSTGIKVKGLNDVMIRFAKCCNPVPGDDIVGFITRGRGATIHRRDCRDILALEANPDRIIETSWNIETPICLPVGINITTGNRQGLLAEITKVIADHKANIINAQIKVTENEKANHKFIIEVKGLKQLEKILDALQSVKDVLSIKRDKSP